MENLLGWEPMYRLSENDLKKKEDVMMLVIHYILIKSGYRCIGLGDDKNLTGSELSSELLPIGWNVERNYTVRYTKENELYILRVVPVDGNMVVNFLKASNLVVSNIAFNVQCTVVSLQGSLDDMVPSMEAVFNRIHAELLEPQNPPANTADASTQTTPEQPCVLRILRAQFCSPVRHPRTDPLRVGPDRDPPLRVSAREPPPSHPFDPFGPPEFGPPDPRFDRDFVPLGARLDRSGRPGRGPRRPPHLGSGRFPGMFL